MSSSPINDLSVVLDDIVYPILSNPKNMESWPEVIKKDVDLHVQELRNVIAEVSNLYHEWKQKESKWSCLNFNLVCMHVKLPLKAIESVGSIIISLFAQHFFNIFIAISIDILKIYIF